MKKSEERNIRQLLVNVILSVNLIDEQAMLDAITEALTRVQRREVCPECTPPEGEE